MVTSRISGSVGAGRYRREPQRQCPDVVEVDRLTEQGIGLLLDLEVALAEGGGWLAAELSAADIAVFAWVQGFSRFGDRFGLTGLRHVRAWVESMAGRPSYGSSLGVVGRPFE
ncbi:MAG: hypothetical protein WD314_06360 [Trueperaceae bacterium]